MGKIIDDLRDEIKTMKELLKWMQEKYVREVAPLEERCAALRDGITLLCTHEHVIKSGGEIWHDYPDHGYFPFHFKCPECGLCASESAEPGTDQAKNYRILRDAYGRWHKE